jgi:hypothetical protein
MLTSLRLTALLLTPAPTDDHPTIVVVVGAEGESEYGVAFGEWADRWKQAASRGSARLVEIGREADSASATDRDRLRDLLKAESKTAHSALWLVLIGHGTFDGHEAKFNLRGPDFSSQELAEWVKEFERPLVVVNCASSSSPFINHLSAAGRVVVTATRSGNELNFARFGDYFSRAIADPAADLDKDDQTSLLEAYLAASRQVEEFYKQESRLATEHALLDDNGDMLGTPAAWFQGVRATRRAKDGAPLDGPRAHQLHLVRSAREETMPAELRDRRDQLELAIEALRDKKTSLGESEYYAQLEKLLLDLAKLYEQAEQEHKAGEQENPAEQKPETETRNETKPAKKPPAPPPDAPAPQP